MYHYSYTMSSLETHSWSCFSYLKRSETDHGFLMVVQCMLGVNFILYEKNIACKYSVFNLWCETCETSCQYWIFLTKDTMVNVDKGILVECDPAMKQFLLQLDDTKALGRKFVIKDLDDTHLFISADILETLQDQVDGLMDKLSFPLAEK